MINADAINVGDLVRMKYVMFWMLKANREYSYSEKPVMVVEVINAVTMRILCPDGTIQRGMIEHYEVIKNEV